MTESSGGGGGEDTDRPVEIAVAAGPPGHEFLYRPGQMLVAEADTARGDVQEYVGGYEWDELPGVVRYRGVDDALETVAGLRQLDSPPRVAPNHVFLGEAAYMGGPAYAGVPAYAGLPAYAGVPTYNTSRPAAPPVTGWPATPPDADGPTVAILDTGIATLPADHVELAGRYETDPGHDDEDRPDGDGNRLLDRQAGHGTFIAGIVRRIAPRARILVQSVLTSFGDGDDFSIAEGLRDLSALLERDNRQLDVLNLSLGGYTDSDRPPLALASMVAELQRNGTVVVAAAGNNGQCRRFFPAALPDVVGVAALDCRGRAWFSNFGSWVRACAPGVDVVSTFFTAFESALTVDDATGVDPSRYHGWAVWSGTSFAAPKVAGAIAELMRAERISAKAAAHRLIDTPGLLALPDLGTVVNIA